MWGNHVLYLCSPFVSSGDIAWPSSDTFTLYSDFGGVTEAAWLPIAAADEDVIEDDASMECCKGSTPMESHAEAAATVEAAAAA